MCAPDNDDNDNPAWIVFGSGECVRLKNFVVNAEITENTIRNCGVIDFFFDNGEDGKNGEGVYIGTSINQVRGGRVLQ